ncbi:hypothetical protein PUN28_015580 [Cardiocondyla obscurior]|uniref:Uncharacterized protein n=1 Tax=Cardiocondyla obscurior TaxID=286306 RepID=A0AAW2EZ36_9HYME
MSILKKIPSACKSIIVYDIQHNCLDCKIYTYIFFFMLTAKRVRTKLKSERNKNVLYFNFHLFDRIEFDLRSLMKQSALNVLFLDVICISDLLKKKKKIITALLLYNKTSIKSYNTTDKKLISRERYKISEKMCLLSTRARERALCKYRKLFFVFFFLFLS